MKRNWFVTLFLAACVVSGCSAGIKGQSDLVGEYVFSPSSAASGRFADLIILKADSTTVEIRFSKATGETTMTKGKWNLSRRNEEFYVAIDDFSHPVEGRSPDLKLGIDDDLGQYYEKVR